MQDDKTNAPAAHGAQRLELSFLERICLWGSALSIVLMLVSIAFDVICRTVFNSSLFGHSDEFGGYLLVAIGFLSLSVCQARDVYHRVEFVLQRMPLWGRAALLIVFDLLSLGFTLVLLWQLCRLEWITWETGETAQTILETPLWIPRLVMPFGAFVLCLSLVKTARMHWRTMQAARVAGKGR